MPRPFSIPTSIPTSTSITISTTSTFIFIFVFVFIFVVFIPIPTSAAATSAYPCYTTGECRTEYQKTHSKCPGRFCGRPLSLDGSAVWSEKCMACRIGTRTDGWACLNCESSLESYDALFLLFLFFGIMSVQAVLIDLTPSGSGSDSSESDTEYRAHVAKAKALFQISAIAEQIIAAMLTFIALPPRGELSIQACPKDGEISEWYSGFFNPSGYACASEVILPLYTAPLVYGGFCILFCVAFRLPLGYYLNRNRPQDRLEHRHPFNVSFSVLGNLLGIPILLIFHAVMGGTLYFGFGYVVIICSLVSSTYIIVVYRKKKLFNMSSILKNPRPLMALIGAYLYCAFAVASVLEYFNQPLVAWWYWVLVFTLPITPPFFTMVTWKYTIPNKFID